MSVCARGYVRIPHCHPIAFIHTVVLIVVLPDCTFVAFLVTLAVTARHLVTFPSLPALPLTSLFLSLFQSNIFIYVLLPVIMFDAAFGLDSQL